MSVGERIIDFFILGIGSMGTFIYLVYVYVKSRSVWVTAFAHIVLNNSASAFSYFVVLQNQLLADLGLALAMVIVATILFQRHLPGALKDYFGSWEGMKITQMSSDILPDSK